MPVTGVFACKLRSRRSAILAHASALYSNLFLSAGFDSRAARARQSLARFLYFATTCIEILAGPNRSVVYLYPDPPFGNNGVGRYQRNTKASTARSFAVQDLPRLALTGPMRTSEPNGVRVTEFSSI